MKHDPIILNCAFRYALGRRTYVVSAVVEAILNDWDKMNESDKGRYVAEILEYKMKHGNLGMEMDAREWEKIVSLYKQDMLKEK